MASGIPSTSASNSFTRCFVHSEPMCGILDDRRYHHIIAEGCMFFNGPPDLEMVFRQPMSAVVVELLSGPITQSIVDVEIYML